MPEPQEFHHLLKNERDQIDKLIKDVEALSLKVRQMESSLIKQPIAQPESKAENHLEVFRQQWKVQLHKDA